MASDVRIAVTLACTDCKRRNYQSNKSKRNDPERIELRKYCRSGGKHTAHRETRCPWARDREKGPNVADPADPSSAEPASSGRPARRGAAEPAARKGGPMQFVHEC